MSLLRQLRASLSRIEREPQITIALRCVEPRERFHSKVIGVTFPNDDGSSRQELIRHVEIGDTLELRPDNHNQADTNAVAVFAGSRQIGFLGRELAIEVRKWLKDGRSVNATISDLTGGEDGKPTLGVNILIEVW